MKEQSPTRKFRGLEETLWNPQKLEIATQQLKSLQDF